MHCITNSNRQRHEKRIAAIQSMRDIVTEKQAIRCAIPCTSASNVAIGTGRGIEEGGVTDIRVK
jgi:hypothetical protein